MCTFGRGRGRGRGRGEKKKKTTDCSFFFFLHPPVTSPYDFSHVVFFFCFYKRRSSAFIPTPPQTTFFFLLLCLFLSKSCGSFFMRIYYMWCFIFFFVFFCSVLLQFHWKKNAWLYSGIVAEEGSKERKKALFYPHAIAVLDGWYCRVLCSCFLFFFFFCCCCFCLFSLFSRSSFLDDVQWLSQKKKKKTISPIGWLLL